MRIITLLLSLTTIFCLSVASMGQVEMKPAPPIDEKSPDTLFIEKVTLAGSGQVAVKFEFANDQQLAALTIPITLKGGGYRIDSVSFADGRVAYLKMLPVTIQEDKKSVIFGAVCMTENYIPEGRGLMATLFLSTVEEEKNNPAIIDTTTIGPATLLFTKTNSVSFVPQFIAGSITHEKPAKPKE